MRTARSADSYWLQSLRPLHILVFLLPLLILYELGTLVYLSQGGMVEVIRARLILSRVMDVFGAVGFHLPAILICVVLLTWHVLERGKWEVRRNVVLAMGLESIAWTIPLVVFAAIVGTAVFAQPAVGAPSAPELTWQGKLVLSLGAGIYEELLFRLVLITVVHMVLVDLFQTSEGAAMVVGAVVSALAFTFYHNTAHSGGGADLKLLAIFGVAGLYFAALFIVRGFGVAVATHALYDVVALLFLGGELAAPPGG